MGGGKGPKIEKTLPTPRKIVKNDTFLRARIAVKERGESAAKGAFVKSPIPM